jgi:hypothetical protein
MTRASRTALVLLLLGACAGGAGCRLRRPDVEPVRAIDPQLLEPSPRAPAAGPGLRVRLLDVQARGHIGRRLTHQLAGGELATDPVWRWSSAPDRYLETVLRMELEARPDLRLVDSTDAVLLTVTLLTWQIEAAESPRLAAAIEITVTDTDRGVHTQVVRRSEPFSGELPGDLAAAAGRLLQGLASEGLERVRQRR